MNVAYTYRDAVITASEHAHHNPHLRYVAQVFVALYVSLKEGK